MNGNQLSMAYRTMVLRSAVAREGELVDLLEKDTIGSGQVLKGALRQIRDASGARCSNNAANPMAATAGGIMELMSSFYARLDEVKSCHSLNVVEGDPAGSMELLLLLLLSQRRLYNNQDNGWGGGEDDHDGWHGAAAEDNGMQHDNN